MCVNQCTRFIIILKIPQTGTLFNSHAVCHGVKKSDEKYVVVKLTRCTDSQNVLKFCCGDTLHLMSARSYTLLTGNKIFTGRWTEFCEGTQFNSEVGFCVSACCGLWIVNCVLMNVRKERKEQNSTQMCECWFKHQWTINHNKCLIQKRNRRSMIFTSWFMVNIEITLEYINK